MVMTGEDMWQRQVRRNTAWKGIILSLLLTPLSFLGAPSLTAQEVGLTAASERKTLRLGEPVVVTVTARVPAAIDSIGPVVSDSAGLFQILSITKTDDAEWAFELMTIDTGTVFVPPLAFGYTMKGDTVGKRAYANALSFQVAGVTVPKDADIKDIKPPMSAPWKWEDLWPFLLLAVVVVAAIYLYRKYRKKKGLEPEAAPEAPKVEPHVRALGELRALEERQLWQQGKVKEYYSEATEIVRRFFEGRWKIPALEMTSDEILLALRDTPEAAQLRNTLGTFFVRADLVKFAKSQPTPEDHQDELKAAYAIVRAMTPADVPSAQETADVR
jgi:hypothetical protein